MFFHGEDMSSCADLTLEEEEAVVAMGLPKNPREWSPEVIRSVYTQWEEMRKNGLEGAQMIEAIAKQTGVPFDIVHAVNGRVITIHIIQEGQLKKGEPIWGDGGKERE